MERKIVFICSGETESDAKNLVDGWMDVDLTSRGVADAEQAGAQLKAAGYGFDVVFTSLMKRSVKTAWAATGACDSVSMPVVNSWRLNDRHYGKLQGADKAEAGNLSSVDAAPPPLDATDAQHPCNDATYSSVLPKSLPGGESFRQVCERVRPMWDDSIGPCLMAGRRVLVVAHKDSLRALSMYVKGLTAEEAMQLDIPAAVPLVYELDENMDCTKSGPLDSAAAGGLKVCMFSKKPCDEELASSLEAEFPGSFSFANPCTAETAAWCKGAQAVCLYIHDECGAEVVATFKNMGVKLILLRCRNHDKLDLAACEAAGIKVVSVKDDVADPIGEHALSLAVCLNRRLQRASNRTKDDNYMLGGLVGIDFNGKTCGIVGTKVTGLAAARCFSAFGMNILCYGEGPFAAEFEALGAKFVSLSELYAASDVISLHVKLTPETRNMIDKAAIDSMRHGVILINVSRGALIDTEALIDGLFSGQVGGAGLDVYEGQEKLFWRDWSKAKLRDRVSFDETFLKLINLPNVLVTPRMCYLTENCQARISECTLASARAFAHGADLHDEARRPLTSARRGSFKVTTPPTTSEEGAHVGGAVEEVSADFSLAVFSADTLWRSHLAPLVRAFPKTVFIDATCSAQSAALCAGSKAVCLFVNDDASREVLSVFRDKGVSLILMRCAGFDRVDLAAAKEFGIRVARVPAYSPYAVAEHAVALALTLNRRLVQVYNRMRMGAYDQTGLVSKDFTGRTVGIIGTGKIGQIAAKIFKSLGMTVICYDKFENDVIKVELGLPYKELDEVLAESDILSLHVPLLPTTQHIINKESIAKTKPGVVIINVSRGGLVDTDALIEGLLSSHVGAAGLDVYENEGGFFFRNFTELDTREAAMRDDTFVLLKALPNVIVTPHSAFLTTDALQAICNTTILNATQFVKEEPLTNVVS
mmetsp:Transcript_94374/g.272782  ORF Transcript_94374/g.272782 Transcript_94374/m.272782 type:complete len:931 (+) Transcript_94374:65-2857(+)